MITVRGYLLHKQVLRKGSHAFYHATRESDNLAVFLKVLENIDPGSSWVANLKREYEILSRLNHPSILKAYEFIEFHGGAALVLEAYDGQEFREYLSQNKLSLRDFLHIAINLSDGIGYLQSNDIIHKDIKPSNILVQKGTFGVKIIDFGIASLIPQEDIEIENHTILEGSLNYISPEQTGRMNRPLDYRSDLYSLGITFYEMLTGRRPFESHDPMELVHAHLAIKPESPRVLVPEVPETVAEIVLKLLEKSPENRYKSCIGLKHDLTKCLHHLEKEGNIPSFEIAKKDFSDKLSISQKIYGREKEIAALLEAFQKSASGHAQVLFVSGVPGIGKSVLVNEIRKPIVEKKGLYIRGKFDQYNRNIPYSAIIEAFQELINYILANNHEELTRWKERILSEVGEFGQLIIDVLPSLELVIGPQHPVSPLPAAEAFNRFSIVFQNFVKAVSTGSGSLVLFLDDLQWADGASIQLLDFLIADNNRKHLMIIGAYRDNEVSTGHPLHTLITDLGSRNNVNQIHLGPIQRNDLTQLLADTFHTHPSEAEQLSALIDAKTQRNPFFVSEFIKSLYKKKLVYFDPATNIWSWSVAQIEQSNFTDNVIELVTETLKSLEPQTRNLCALAASIGNQFDLRSLSLVYEKDFEHTANDLWQAIKEGVIVPLSDQYRSVGKNIDSADKIIYKFLHDRVQQAAYNVIPEEEKSGIHLKIGRLLLEEKKNQKSENRIFEIVNHLNKGKELIDHAAEKIKLAGLNSSAGRKAKQSSAFGPAFGYFSTAIALLPENCWQSQYSLTLSLYNEAAEMAYLSVRPEEVAYYTDEIFAHAANVLDTLNAYLVKIAFHGSQGHHAKSVEVSYEILHKLGVKLPAKPSQLHVLGGLISTKLILRGKSADDIFSLPEMQDENWKAAMSVLSVVTGSAYITNTNLFVLIVFRMIALSIKHGKNRFTSFGFAVLGMVIAGLMDLDGVKKYSELSRRLLESYPEDEQYSKINYCLLTLHFLHHPIRNSQRLMFHNIQKAFDTGDFLYGSYSVFYHLSLKFYGGYHLQSLIPEIEPLCEKLDALNQKVALGWTHSVMQIIHNLSHIESSESRLNGKYFKEDEMLLNMQQTKNVSGITLMYVMEGTLAYTLGDYTTAIASLKKSTKTLDSMVGTPMVSAYHFYLALALAAEYGKQGPLERFKTRRTLNNSISLYKKWDSHCTENNYARLNILLGVKASLKNRLNAGVNHFKAAAVHAEEHHLTQEMALAHELLALLYANNNQLEAYLSHISEARFHYHQWGAMAKVRQLEEHYKLHPAERSSGPINPEHTTYSTDSLDLQTVIKSSQALSSEVQLEGLFNKMIHIVMENAGATACAILLKQSGNWSQRVSNRIENGSRQLRLDAIEVSEKNSDTLDFPLSITNYVVRTHKVLSIDHPRQNPAYANDPYLVRHNPQSVLCLPFSSKGEEMGVLYLENDLISNAFTEDRIRLLSIVTAQLAISIDNAFLYESLEQKVQDRTADLVLKNQELEAEKKKSDQLLLNILPEEIAEELKERKHAKARRHAHATVLFVDVKGFTSIAADLSPEDLVTMLHQYFSRFDDISTLYGLEKIKTIGDAYMAVGGVPDNNKAGPAEVVKAARDMIRVSHEMAIENQKDNRPFFEIRIGIHTGPVVSGIVGKSKFQFDIWGDTVNVAARLEQTSEPGKINISRTTYDEISNLFTCEPRGTLPIKNRSEVEMFFVS